jgi:hypothetical protein
METSSGLPNVEIYEQLIQDHVLFTYNGEIDGELIDMLVQLAEKVLKKACSKLKSRKKVVNILIESLQNSFHYTQHLLHDLEQNTTTNKAFKSPFLVLYRELTETLPAETNEMEIVKTSITLEEERYWILTGNWVDNESVQKLQKRIEILQNLSDDELQEHYLKALNKDVIPTAGGAGLGLIDMMRRSNRQVFFEFKETEGDFSVFMLKIKVA